MRKCDKCGKVIRENYEDDLDEELILRELIFTGYDLCFECERKIKKIIDEFVRGSEMNRKAK